MTHSICDETVEVCKVVNVLHVIIKCVNFHFPQIENETPLLM